MTTAKDDGRYGRCCSLLLTTIPFFRFPPSPSKLGKKEKGEKGYSWMAARTPGITVPEPLIIITKKEDKNLYGDEVKTVVTTRGTKKQENEEA